MGLTTDRAEEEQFSPSLKKAGEMRKIARDMGHYNGGTDLTPACQDGVRDFGAEGVSAIAGYGPSDGTPGLPGANDGAAVMGEPTPATGYRAPSKTGAKLRGNQP